MTHGTASPQEAIRALAHSEPHTHLCIAHRTRQQSLAAVTLFLRRGLERGEQCVYIAHDDSRSSVTGALQPEGVVVEEAARKGALSILTCKETYLRDGYFDPERMLAWIRERAAAATGAGFSALRIVGEMICVSGKHPGVDRLAEYEAKLNYLIADHPVSALCQYDRSRFGALDVREAFATHPLVVVGTTVCRNPHFVAPDDYLAQDWPVGEVERVLDNLRRDQTGSSELGESLEHYRRLARRLLEAQEVDRRAISRELHDNLAQVLSTIHLHLQAISGARPAQRARNLGEADALVTEAMDYVRDFAFDLRPSLLDDVGLAAALRSYVRRQAERGGFDVTLDLGALEGQIPPSVATTCFQIVQEALANVVRHASAPRVHVTVSSDTAALELVVQDDGNGFDPLAARRRAVTVGSLGLLGMAERAALVGGKLIVESSAGHGTTLRARLPLGDRSPP
jgi:signal transduction histidine kinase